MSMTSPDNEPRVPGHALTRISGVQGICECGAHITLDAVEVRAVVSRRISLADALIDGHEVHLAVIQAWEGR
jgi:hypothetical protein